MRWIVLLVAPVIVVRAVLPVAVRGSVNRTLDGLSGYVHVDHGVLGAERPE